jgi:hypothetical protein
MMSPRLNKIRHKRGSAMHAGRRIAVAVIKTVHTLIFGIIAVSVLHVFWAGVWGRPSRQTPVAAAIVLLEMAIFAGNRWRCPLTGLAERFGAESGRVTDIFLPRWVADRVPQIFTPPFVIGLAFLIGRWWRDRTQWTATARGGHGVGSEPAHSLLALIRLW